MSKLAFSCLYKCLSKKEYYIRGTFGVSAWGFLGELDVSCGSGFPRFVKVDHECSDLILEFLELVHSGLLLILEVDYALNRQLELVDLWVSILS